MLGKIKITNLDDHLLPNIACTKPVENPAQLTLSDCLACSGCITTAETVLL
jgi:iron only hydrogenase large subunit-like protein